MGAGMSCTGCSAVVFCEHGLCWRCVWERGLPTAVPQTRQAKVVSKPLLWDHLSGCASTVVKPRVALAASGSVLQWMDLFLCFYFWKEKGTSVSWMVFLQVVYSWSCSSSTCWELTFTDWLGCLCMEPYWGRNHFSKCMHCKSQQECSVCTAGAISCTAFPVGSKEAALAQCRMQLLPASSLCSTPCFPRWEGRQHFCKPSFHLCLLKGCGPSIMHRTEAHMVQCVQVHYQWQIMDPQWNYSAWPERIPHSCVLPGPLLACIIESLWLDWVILWVFSNLNDSMILWLFIRRHANIYYEHIQQPLNVNTIHSFNYNTTLLQI